MAEKKQRLFNLPQTKGAYQVKGLVNGMKKDDVLKEIECKSGKEMRILKFGVEVDDKKSVYMTIQGMEQEYAYFSKRAENKGEKSQVEKVSWDKRFSFNKEGFGLIGKKIGVEKVVEEATGKEVNNKKTLTDFDACKEIADKLKDDASVFIKGEIEYGTYIDGNGNPSHSIKYVPSQVSLCSDVDFDEENFEQVADFNQVIIFTGIDQEKDDAQKPTGRFIVSAKIVNYSTIEDVEFIMVDSKLAGMFKKNLKPYNALKVNGNISVEVMTEDATDDDCWGEKDSMQKVNDQVKREMIITGATPSTIDRETYTEESVLDAINKIKNASKAESDFNAGKDNGEWGDNSDLSNDEDEAWD